MRLIFTFFYQCALHAICTKLEKITKSSKYRENEFSQKQFVKMQYETLKIIFDACAKINVTTTVLVQLVLCGRRSWEKK